VLNHRLPRDHGLLVQLAEQFGGLPAVDNNDVSFLVDTEATIERLIEDIDTATDHVHLMFYIYQDDEVGRRVADALIRARSRGVSCRVLADGVGSRRLFRRLAPEMRNAGIEVVDALPAKLYRIALARLDLRNHRKLAVIDGRVAYAGSQNIVEPTYGHPKAGVWHDIMARITGPVVQQLQGIFLEDWFHESGQLIDATDLATSREATGEVAVQVVPSGPDLPRDEFQDLVVKAILLAQRQVVITSPYFVPNEGVLMALRLAALRGVRVVLVVPRRSDHRVVDAAGSFYLEYLAAFGIEVYFHQEGFLHAKTLTVDDDLALFGSANYDIRSFDLNFELSLFLHDQSAVAELYALQERYLRESRPATDADWPSRTFTGRLKVNLAKLLAPLL